MFDKKKYMKEWRKNNKKQRKRYMKQWRKDNPEYRKEYYQNNKEEEIKNNKQWRNNNPEWEKQWNKTEKGKAHNQRGRSKIRAGKREIINTLTADEWIEILKEYKYRCAYCGKEFDLFNKPERDHKIPISKGGNNIKENVIPACRSCNSKKGNKI